MISVIYSYPNRADLLIAALESLRGQFSSSGQFEVLVIELLSG